MMKTVTLLIGLTFLLLLPVSASTKPSTQDTTITLIDDTQHIIVLQNAKCHLYPIWLRFKIRGQQHSTVPPTRKKGIGWVSKGPQNLKLVRLGHLTPPTILFLSKDNHLKSKPSSLSLADTSSHNLNSSNYTLRT